MSDLQDELARPRIQLVEVINRNDFVINDRFDGVPISFPPNEKVDVSLAIAAHCFGFVWQIDQANPDEGHWAPLDERAQHIAARYGWVGRDYLKEQKPGAGVAKYVEMAGLIELKPIYYKMVRENPDDPIPLDTGDEAADRATPTMEADTSTKVGKRKSARPKRGDRHRPAGTRNQKLRLG